MNDSTVDRKIAAPRPVDGVRPHFAMSRRSGHLLFVSGQLPFDSTGSIHGTDVSTQTRRCLDNIAAILAEQGLDLDAVTKATVWLKHKEDFGRFNATYAEYFKSAQVPTRSTVTAELMVEGALVEIEVVAEFPDQHA